MDGFSVGAGFAVGLITGVCGVGGGSLMTPLLTLGLGVPPMAAVGTDLAFAAATKTVGAAAHRRQGTVDARVAGWLCLGALPSALASALWVSAWGGNQAPDRWIFGAVGFACALAALALAFKNRLARWGASSGAALSNRARRALTVAAGAVIGALVAATSVGAGAIGASALALLYPRLSSAQIAGTDIAFALPLAAVAAAAHWWLGSIDWVLAGALLIGSAPGIAAGAWLSKRLPETVTRGVLTLALLAACGSMLSKAL